MAQVPQPPQPSQPPVPPGVPGQTNGLAIAGMVCGILGVVLFWIPYLGIILGILGLVFGFLGRNRAVQLGGVGQGMAMAGIVTGAVAVVAGILWIIFIVTQVDEARDILEEFESEFSLARAHLAL
ncbi:MAG: DUF4190 domain-containing protein [Actinomycetota bacterium]|jgi:hypothetical protein